MFKCKLYSLDYIIDESIFYTEDIKFALYIASNFESELWLFSYKRDIWYPYEAYTTHPELFKHSDVLDEPEDY